MNLANYFCFQLNKSEWTNKSPKNIQLFETMSEHNWKESWQIYQQYMKWYKGHTQLQYYPVFSHVRELYDYYTLPYKTALQHKGTFVDKKLEYINRWIQNPHSGHSNCSLLLLWHQKYKHWIKIPCDDRLLDMKSLYCMESQINTTSNTSTFQPQVSTQKWKWNGHVLLNMFSCDEGYLFSSKRMCDVKTDCPKQEDEYRCQTVLNGYKIYSIKVQHFQITSHLKAKSVTELKLTCLDSNIRCIYDINDKQINRFQRHCEGGEHLDLCESFSCNVTYKCPRYYCIPWHYVCDGHWDCPFGYDEEDCKPKLRPGFYHCSNSVVLILTHSVCDDFIDCPEGDDQQNCELHNLICPPSCF